MGSRRLWRGVSSKLAVRWLPPRPFVPEGNRDPPGISRQTCVVISCYRVNGASRSHTEVLTPRNLRTWPHLETGSLWMLSRGGHQAGSSPSLMGVLIKRGNLDTETDTHMRGDGDRDGGDASTSHRTSEEPAKQELREAWGPRRDQLSRHLSLRLPASRPVGVSFSVV